jgi:predicted PurR-regulated permease PerM
VHGRTTALDYPPGVEERWISFRPKAILSAIAVIVLSVIVLWVVWLARSVLVWALIAVFLAMALNPAVDWVMGRGVRRRGVAVAIVYVATLVLIAGISATFVPTVVNEVNDLIAAIPTYVDDLTNGRGKLGFLQREYQIVDKLREAIETSGAAGVLGLSTTALSVTKSIITAIIAVITIAFLTLFMLLEGPAWTERMFSLFPERSQPRWRRIGHEIYRTVGGYVTGNLAISVVAGVTSTVVLLILGVDYAVALGLLVAILDLIPLAGATIAAVVVSTIGFLDSLTAGIVLVCFFLVYQQLENHVLQPLVYGRTVRLSPLVVLVSVLVGAELAGVIGALGAIPIAGSIQVFVADYLDQRRQKQLQAAAVDLPPTG